MSLSIYVCIYIYIYICIAASSYDHGIVIQHALYVGPHLTLRHSIGLAWVCTACVFVHSSVNTWIITFLLVFMQPVDFHHHCTTFWDFSLLSLTSTASWLAGQKENVLNSTWNPLNLWVERGLCVAMWQEPRALALLGGTSGSAATALAIKEQSNLRRDGGHPWDPR